MCHQAGLSIYVIRLDSLHICHQAGLFNHVSSSWTLYSCFIRLDSLHMCHQAGLSTHVIRLDSLHICHQAGLSTHVSSGWTLYTCVIRLDSLQMCHQRKALLFIVPTRIYLFLEFLYTNVIRENSTVHSDGKGKFVSGCNAKLNVRVEVQLHLFMN